MNGRIDWDAIHGARASSTPTYSDDQIAQAVAAAKALAGKKNDPNKIPTPWPQPDSMPTLADIDFRGLTTKKLPIAGLLASNKNIGRDKLIWHIQNPGQAKNPSVFTTNPIVMTTDEGNVIVDGHHRLFADQLLGQTSCTCWLVPTK